MLRSGFLDLFLWALANARITSSGDEQSRLINPVTELDSILGSFIVAVPPLDKGVVDDDDDAEAEEEEKEEEEEEGEEGDKGYVEGDKIVDEAGAFFPDPLLFLLVGESTSKSINFPLYNS